MAPAHPSLPAAAEVTPRKGKPTTDRVSSAVRALITSFKGYKHTWISADNLLLLVQHHFLQDYDFDAMFLNRALGNGRDVAMKMNLSVWSANPVGLCKGICNKKAFYYMMEIGGSVVEPDDGREWWHEIRQLHPITVTRTKRAIDATDNFTGEGSPPAKRVAIATSVSPLEESEHLQRAKAIQKETYWDSTEARILFAPDYDSHDNDSSNNVREVIKERIKVLVNVCQGNEGWRELVADRDKYDAMTGNDIYMLSRRIKAQAGVSNASAQERHQHLEAKRRH
jgi:hypothetical protein